MNFVTVEGIKDKLVGLDPWFAAAAAAGVNYDDDKITSYIDRWTRRFERDTTFRINPVQVVSAPDGTYNTPTAGSGTISSKGNLIVGTGTSFTSLFQPGNVLVVNNLEIEVESIQDDHHLTLISPAPPWNNVSYGMYPMLVIQESGYGYYQMLTEEYFVTTFKERPVQQVQRLRLMYNGQYLLYDVPTSWYSVDTKAGRFWLLPTFGQAVMTGAATAIAAFSAVLQDHMPNFLFYDYIAGLPENWHYMREYSDVKIILEEYCALQVLKDIANVIDPGKVGKSVSGAGISQSTNYDRFTPRKQELNESIEAFKATLTAQETPFMLDVL